jgi:hypothetical protein
MSRQTAVAAVAAFALALALGFVIGGTGEDGLVADGSSAPSATTTAAATGAVFIQPGETVIGPAVVIAERLVLDGEQVTLAFELESLAPVGDAADITRFLGFRSTEIVPAEDLDTVFLDKWVLVTSSGDIPGTVANPIARTARFDVGPNFSLESVTEVRLASYSLRIPIGIEFSVDLDDNTAEIAPGLTARLVAVTEQTRTIVQVELSSDRDLSYSQVGISGVGPGWKSAVRAAEGRARWNLTYDFPEAPSPISLMLSGSIWVDIDAQPQIVLEAAG